MKVSAKGIVEKYPFKTVSFSHILARSPEVTDFSVQLICGEQQKVFKLPYLFLFCFLFQLNLPTYNALISLTTLL